MKLNLIEHFDGERIGSQVSVEDGYVFVGEFGEFFDFHEIGEGLFDCNFVLGRVFHQEDVHDVDYEEDEGLPELDLVSVEKEGDDQEVEEDE